MSSKRKTMISMYALMLPGLAYFLINNYLPMCGVFIAFKSIDYSVGIFQSPFIGLKNFDFLFRTPDALLITRNTLLYNLMFIVISIVMGVIVAIFLNEIRTKLCRNLCQTALLLPQLVSMVIASYLVYAFLSSENGFLNKSVLPALGMKSISWYTTPAPWPFILLIVQQWHSLGMNTIIFLASILGIDRALYESAELDGAGKWKQVWYITLPCLKSTVIVLFMISLGKIFYSDFGLFYLIPQNSGMLYDVTSTLDTYVYRALMKLNDIGMSSAAGLYQSVVGFILVLSVNLLLRKVDPENAMF